MTKLLAALVAGTTKHLFVLLFAHPLTTTFYK
jgi:hypothetical protein